MGADEECGQPGYTFIGFAFIGPGLRCIHSAETEILRRNWWTTRFLMVKEYYTLRVKAWVS